MKITLLAILWVISTASFAISLGLTPQKTHSIAQQIWQNEGNQDPNNIISWNRGENFLSLGIGHFIWFPKGYAGPFKQSFPDFLRYARSHHAKLPQWLINIPPCPWSSRQQFIKAVNSIETIELKAFLLKTFDLQAQYIAEHAEKSLRQLPPHIPVAHKKHVNAQLQRVLNSHGGAYALIDYINFKGLGLVDKEEYNNQRWGLLQVLETMRGDARGKIALVDFSNAAKKVLQNRVNNSPPERNETRWIPGWFKRVSTYKQTIEHAH